MPEPGAPAVESQAAASTAPATLAAESAAPPDRPSLGTLADAFRADPDGAALKGRGPRARSGRQSDDEASPEESAGPDATASGAASKPGETPGLSRRGAAAAILEKDAEIERLVAERTAEKARAEQAAARVAALERGQDEARKAALSKIGDDAEFERLQQARLRNRTLSYEEDERLDGMLAWREHASVLWELADKAHRVGMAKAVAERADEYGLDKDTAFGSDLAGLLDHAVAATEARVKAESAEKIAALEAELKGLRPRGAAGRTVAPTTGGSSAPGGHAGSPGDGASAEDWFRYGIEQRSAAGARNGAAGTRR